MPHLKFCSGCSRQEASENTTTIETLEFLLQINCPFNFEVATSAASYGHLDTLKWLKSKEQLAHVWEGHLDEIFTSALRSGRVDMLEWLSSFSTGPLWKENSLASALKSSNGSTDVVKWLLAQGAVWNEQCSVNLTYGEKPQFRKWLIQQGCSES